MTDPDDAPSRADDLLAQLMRQDLDPLSVAELEARIAVAGGGDRARPHRRYNAPLTIAQAPTSYSGDERDGAPIGGGPRIADPAPGRLMRARFVPT